MNSNFFLPGRLISPKVLDAQKKIDENLANARETFGVPEPEDNKEEREKNAINDAQNAVNDAYEIFGIKLPTNFKLER